MLTVPEHEPLLKLRGLGKSYAAPVLSDLDLEIAPGEVHALIGANGAGKSTLARILSGLTLPDQGTMRLGGSAYAPASKAEAEARGVQIVQQELNLIGTLSVAENLFLGRLPSLGGVIRRTVLRGMARAALAEVGLDDIDPDLPAEQLGVGQQQLVEIAAALVRKCRLLILDEPTAALTDPQIDVLFRHVDRLRSEGVSIIYISHRLIELQRIADRVSVLRDGRLVETRAAANLDLDEAVRLMVGAAPLERVANEVRPRGPLAMRVEHLTRAECVRDVSFDLHRGEVLGLAGLVGSGRTELLRAIVGADRADSGTIRLGLGGPPQRLRSPGRAVRAGIGMIPEDRKADGLLLPLPIAQNMSLATMRRFRRWPGRIDGRAERIAAEGLGGQVELRCRDVSQPVAELSGGNQQKVLISRWLLRDPDVFLFDEPTRGIDVGAKATVYRLIDDLARRGKAILVVSSELEELMLLCDRIAVLSAGRLVRTFDRGSWSNEALLAAAFQEHATRPSNPGVPADA